MDNETSSENTGYPAPKDDYPAHQAGCSETQAENTVPKAGCSASQPGFSGMQSEYLILPPGYSVIGAVGIPVQFQPVSLQPSVPARLLWIPKLPPSSDCPPGLEYLNQVDQIQIHQQIELTEVIISYETNNKYEIKNSLGQRIYYAAEDTALCTRFCYGSYRPFIMRIHDLKGQEVITLKRPLRCTSCCFPCCLQEIEIYAPPGIPIGYVTQTWHPYQPKFTIQNENKKDVLRITGPYFVCNTCGNVEFKIKSLDGKNVVGKISKQFTRFMREIFTHYSNFVIQFPADTDVKMKAVILGMCFLIDFMFYDNNGCIQLLTAGTW
ncbi:phospholipid scramblase 2-like [Balaenoptera musculus]|uniref:Phospholipid scramblase n=1 Tax=Balaenoptera musculus TaxID=9771 RepID=A0A8B8XB43_BALMU|nr:phospholipid scramblase 2-like [Balaenoptera musculus]